VKVSWDDDIPNIWKNKTCSKPPTSNDFVLASTGSASVCFEGMAAWPLGSQRYKVNVQFLEAIREKTAINCHK
jgi:hypothetical protein